MARKPKTKIRHGRPMTTPIPLPSHPLEWWRTEHAEFFNGAAVVAMRNALATVVVLGESGWRAAAAGDAPAAIGLALRLNPQRSTGNAYDLIMTALAACAADGSDGAALVLSHLMRKMPNASNTHGAIATSWLLRSFAQVTRRSDLGEPL
ncbi:MULTISPECIES: hypothetical protein [unclassified Bradyrhizobium]|uniref:hypothetical protein n=1 Tax=unclassified Bradyrhizobium TaxID=2631580 RepID=UPI002FF40319